MKSNKRYSIEDYDKYICLKPDAEMWLAMAYLSHGFVLLMIYVVGTLRMKGGRGGFEYLGDISPIFVVGSLPAILVIWVYFKRAPDKRGKVLWLWKNGRSLLILSCLANMLQPLMTVFSTRPIHAVTILLLIIDSIVLVYLAVSPRVKDVFSEYPAEAASQPDARR